MDYNLYITKKEEKTVNTEERFSVDTLAYCKKLTFRTETTWEEFGCTFSIASIQMDKEMYAPGYIEATVQVTPTNSGSSDEDTHYYTFTNIDIEAFDKMLGCKVTLSDEKDNVLAKDYIIFDVQPEYRKNASFYLKLIIYSPEKILTFKKFNQCHVLERLGQDIFTGIAKKHPDELPSSSCTHLQHLMLPSEQEFLQPYLVQYDETELDFLTRMANRCGEFMFYEDGSWQLGLDIDKEERSIDKDFESLTFKRSQKRDMAMFWANNYTHGKEDDEEDEEDEVEEVKIEEPADKSDPKNSTDQGTAAKAWQDDYDKETDPYRKKALNQYMYDKKYITKEVYKKNKTGIEKEIAKDKKAREAAKKKEKQDKEEARKKINEWQNYTGPADEYLASHTKRDNYWASYKEATVDFKLADLCWWLEKVTSALEKLTPVDIIKSFVSKAGTDAVMSFFKCQTWDKLYNKQNVERFEKFSDFITEKGGEKTITPLTTPDAVDTYTSDFYTGVLACETEAERRAVHVDMGTNYTVLLLGDIVTLMNKKYVVVNISMKCSKKDAKSTEADTTLSFDAIPLLENGSELHAYPAPIKGGTNRKAEAQMAIVTSAFDPYQLGRVQIRYPWQKEPASIVSADKKNKLEVPCSPWIRVATPYNSDGSGIKFVPQVGDEIMVDYEYGDIERPYMVGAVASKDVPGNELYYGEEEKYVIRSPFGQYIKFEAPVSRSKFLANAISPAFGALATYVPPIKKAVNENFEKWFGKDFSGGISISDSFGIFDISASTEERSISITSTLGDVEISALTGITIKAPNGDITIKGKNVEIEAGNTLTLKSGTNHKPKAFVNDSWGDYITDIVSEMTIKPAYTWLKSQAQLIDLSLVRCILEAVIKPVGGEMLIKSDTFLKLEAGGESTDLPDAAYVANTEGYEDKIEKKLKQGMVRDTVVSANRAVDEIVDIIRAYTNIIGAKKDLYKRKLEGIYKSFEPHRQHSVSIFLVNTNNIRYSYRELDFEKFLKDNKIETADEIIEKALKGEWKGKEDLSGSHPQLDQITCVIHYIKKSGGLGVRKKITNYQPLINAKKEAAEALEDIIRTINARDIFKDTNDIGHFGDKVKLSMRVFANAVDPKQEIYDYEKIKGYINDLNLAKQAEDIDLTEALTQQGRGKDMVAGEAITQFRRKILFQTLGFLKHGKYLLIQNDDNAGEAVQRVFSAKLKSRILLDVNNEEACCKDQKNWTTFLRCVKEYDKDEDEAGKKEAGAAKKFDDAWKAADNRGGFVGAVKKTGIGIAKAGHALVPLAKDFGQSLIDWENIEELMSLSENHTRNPNVKGEILFSDPQGNTCNFKNGTIQHTRTNPFEDAKKLMKDI